MQSLKPTECIVEFTYRCKCGMPMWVSQKQACSKDFILTCYCGKSYKIPILKKVKLTFGKTKKVFSKCQNRVVDILSSQGYNKIMVKGIVEKIPSSYDIKQGLKFVLKQVKEYEDESC